MEAKRPPTLTEQHMQYLTDLHSTGSHNMWDAVSHVERVFNVERNEAQAIVAYWVENNDPKIIC